MTESEAQKNSLQFWEKYGDFILLAMPYDDAVIVKARGATVTDADGNEVIDLTSGQFCSILGHNHPKLIERIKAQMDQVLHTSTDALSPVVFETAAKLAAVAPGELRKSLFLSTGSEANEAAFRIAKIATGKTGIVGLSQGYYGISLATSNAGLGWGRGPASAPGVPDTFRLLTPYCMRCPVGATFPECDVRCLQTSEALLHTQVEGVAAFIVEPILSGGGMIVPPPGYLRRLYDLSRKCGALLIADEAQTGFGRTGKWFGVEHDGVVPDIITFCKTAGGGFPVSGVITTDAVARKLGARGFSHLSSHQSDPVGAAALGAVIDIVREEGLVDRAEEMGRYFRDRLLELKARQPVIADVRGMGLMIGVELVCDPATREPAEDLGPVVRALCLRKGVHVGYTTMSHIFRLMPPLTITKEELDRAVDVFDESITEALQHRYRPEDFLPTNPYSRRVLARSGWRPTLQRYLHKLWETSPEELSQTVRRKIGR